MCINSDITLVAKRLTLSLERLKNLPPLSFDSIYFPVYTVRLERYLCISKALDTANTHYLLASKLLHLVSSGISV